MATKTKAVKTDGTRMKELRARRKAAGLVPVTVYIKPDSRKRLEDYVNKTLKGECPKSRK